ncbi:acyltransferase [Lachnoclostridium sp. An138]|uniref:acyltransferase n=1 Tax=Lachnoclostridium sp. An138 TaxID=1965560 RepID=UPI000B36E2F0|nr:acyltransferase [Lachnoclostridium sp. An138]OUQ19857.1 hypothetical protein B5E82_03270 [Lachnoclostridium sp. An138]
MLQRMNIPKNIFNKIYNLFWLHFKHVVYGKKLRIEGRILLQGRGKIEIGENVTIYSHYAINPIGGDRTVFQVMNGAALKIGNHVAMSHAIISAHNTVIIEDEVMLGAGCKIFDTDFHSLDYEERVHGQDQDVNTAPVIIKKGAFIGTQAMILKGVIIGEKSIVGAGAVVTKNIPDGEVWAGNPARCIKKFRDVGRQN